MVVNKLLLVVKIIFGISYHTSALNVCDKGLISSSIMHDNAQSWSFSCKTEHMNETPFASLFPSLWNLRILVIYFVDNKN